MTDTPTDFRRASTPLRTHPSAALRARRLIATGCCSLALLFGTAPGVAAQTNSADRPTTSSISSPAPAPIGGVIADAIQDFRQIPSWTNVAILAAGGIGAALAHPSDLGVSRTMAGSPGMGSFFRIGETVGGARVQFGAALGAYAIGHISGQNRVAAIGADLIQSQILAQTMTAAIKMSVQRTRPDGTQYSFPSGHSSVSFATATVLQRNLGWKVGVPAYGLATYVAASRIQDKRHFLSDVTFGAAIGIVAGRSVTVGRGDAKFAIAPAAAPGGGGISFTWLGPH
jgi:membrane-associated phospholipid phosphatase